MTHLDRLQLLWQASNAHSHCVTRRVQKTQVCPANCALHVLANVCPPQAEDIRSRCPHTFSHYSQFRHLCAASILTAVQGREGCSRTSDTVNSPSWPLQGCAYTCQVLVVRGVSLPGLRATATSRHEPSEEERMDYVSLNFLFSPLPVFLSSDFLEAVHFFYVLCFLYIFQQIYK